VKLNKKNKGKEKELEKEIVNEKEKPKNTIKEKTRNEKKQAPPVKEIKKVKQETIKEKGNKDKNKNKKKKNEVKKERKEEESSSNSKSKSSVSSSKSESESNSLVETPHEKETLNLESKSIKLRKIDDDANSKQTTNLQNSINNSSYFNYKDPNSCGMCENIYKNSIIYGTPIKSTFKCSYCQNNLNENSLRFYEMVYSNYLQSHNTQNSIYSNYNMPQMAFLSQNSIPMINNTQSVYSTANNSKLLHAPGNLNNTTYFLENNPNNNSFNNNFQLNQSLMNQSVNNNTLNFNKTGRSGGVIGSVGGGGGHGLHLKNNTSLINQGNSNLMPMMNQTFNPYSTTINANVDGSKQIQLQIQNSNNLMSEREREKAISLKMDSNQLPTKHLTNQTFTTENQNFSIHTEEREKDRYYPQMQKKFHKKPTLKNYYDENGGSTKRDEESFQNYLSVNYNNNSNYNTNKKHYSNNSKIKNKSKRKFNEKDEIDMKRKDKQSVSLRKKLQYNNIEFNEVSYEGNKLKQPESQIDNNPLESDPSFIEDFEFEDEEIINNLSKFREKELKTNKPKFSEISNRGKYLKEEENEDDDFLSEKKNLKSFKNIRESKSKNHKRKLDDIEDYYEKENENNNDFYNYYDMEEDVDVEYYKYKKNQYLSENLEEKKKQFSKEDCLLVFTNDNYSKSKDKVKMKGNKKEKESNEENKTKSNKISKIELKKKAKSKDKLSLIPDNSQEIDESDREEKEENKIKKQGKVELDNEEEEDNFLVTKNKKSEALNIFNTEGEKNFSLAEMFKNKKKGLIEKIETREVDTDTLKEKYKVKLNIQAKSVDTALAHSKPVEEVSKSKKREPPAELLDRLRKGEKVQVRFFLLIFNFNLKDD